MSALRDDVLLALVKADEHPWEGVSGGNRHTVERIYGKQADAVVAVVRAQIKADLLAAAEAPSISDYSDDFADGQRSGLDIAARIAGGEWE